MEEFQAPETWHLINETALEPEEINDPRIAEPSEWLCSYPKTGRTWVRYMLARVMMHQYGLPVREDILGAYEVIPMDESKSNYYPEPAFPFTYAGQAPKIGVTHAPYEAGVHETTKPLFMTRDPRDTLVSHWFHLKHQEGYQESMPSFVRDPQLGIEGFLDYHAGWAPHLDDRQVISYEEMKADPQTGMKKVLDHFRIPAPEDTIQLAIDAGSFQMMQKKEIQHGVPQPGNNPALPDARRVRRGVVGGYVDYLMPDDLDFIDERVQAADLAVRALISRTGYPIHDY